MTEKNNTLPEMKREAENQKEMGNKHFKSGNIDESIKCYSEAIKLFASNPIFYCNRSIAYLKKGLAIEAEKDCDSALNIDQNCIKALYRRGMARKHLLRYNLAADDFKRVLSLDPNNKEAKRELQDIQRLITSKTIVDIKPFEKKKEFQSNKPLVRVPVIEKNSIIMSEIESKIPEKLPQSYYQLECDWRQFVGKNSKDLKREYLEAIGSERIQTLLTSTLEPQMMSEILDSISDSNDMNLMYSVLKQMSKTPRFATLVLFMSDTDQKAFNKIIAKLKQNNFDQNLIEDIQRQYS